MELVEEIKGVLEANEFTKKTENIQDAHEAIRPTSINRRPFETGQLH